MWCLVLVSVVLWCVELPCLVWFGLVCLFVNVSFLLFCCFICVVVCVLVCLVVCLIGFALCCVVLCCVVLCCGLLCCVVLCCVA